jgi:hypothetical protein
MFRVLINKSRCNFYQLSEAHFFSTVNQNCSYDEYKYPVLPRKPRSKGEPFDFVDYKQIICSSGKGGDGLISFLREKNNEFGY